MSFSEKPVRYIIATGASLAMASPSVAMQDSLLYSSAFTTDFVPQNDCRDGLAG